MERKKMIEELERREQAPALKAAEDQKEAEIARRLKEEIAKVKAMHANKGGPGGALANEERNGSGSVGLEQERILKIRWFGHDYSVDKLGECLKKFGTVEDLLKVSKEKESFLDLLAVMEEQKMIEDLEKRERSSALKAAEEEEENKGAVGELVGLEPERVFEVRWLGEDYTVDHIKECFKQFGTIEDVLKHSKKSLALVVMSNKQEAMAATTSTESNQFLVLPVKPEETDRLKDFAGLEHKYLEDYVLDKLTKCVKKQKLEMKRDRKLEYDALQKGKGTWNTLYFAEKHSEATEENQHTPSGSAQTEVKGNKANKEARLGKQDADRNNITKKTGAKTNLVAGTYKRKVNEEPKEPSQGDQSAKKKGG